MAAPTPPHRWPVQVSDTWAWTPPVDAGIGPDHSLSLEISWCVAPSAFAPLSSASEPLATGEPLAVVLIHGFGACKEHWRHTLPALGAYVPTYALDLVGFGASSQPRARLADEPSDSHSLHYGFELWGAQVAAFCREMVGRPVLLVGNSIGGVVALRAAQLLNADAGPSPCRGLVLIDCAQRLMDDKQLSRQPTWMAWIRPLLKAMVRQRWLSTALFRNAARPALIRQVLRQAYPSGGHVDDELVELLYRPSRRPGAAEAFRGFINLFNDHLAPDLLADLALPVHLIWGEADPWEPVAEARAWAGRFACIRSLQVLPGVGHCPHDEAPDLVNPLLLAIAEQASGTQQAPSQQAT
jgi:pimeloyl-ACP methyl ester carboxylesterase